MTAAATDKAEKASALRAQLKRSLRALYSNIICSLLHLGGTTAETPNDPRWWEGAL